MSLKSLDDLFLHTLQDLYWAEKKLVETLPKMAKEADSEEFAQALTDHLEETNEQVTRIEQIFKIIGKEPKAKKCAAMEGLVEEGKEIIEESEDPSTCDAGMLATAQAIEHYEIGRYGAMIAWAEELGIPDAVELLEDTLEEEENADKLLSELAESKLNREAKAA